MYTDQQCLLFAGRTERLSTTAGMDDCEPHVWLTTCNRTELYWGEGAIPEDIIRHLYRVAAGLESELPVNAPYRDN
jgi:glutamyl-tRNA reductase